jgi:hypothetical protein
VPQKGPREDGLNSRNRDLLPLIMPANQGSGEVQEG